MPELPEVEVVRAGLQRWAVGRTIKRVEVLHPRSVRRHLAGGPDFEARLVGQRMVAARRRGKYLWVALSSGDAVVGHLGMSGQILMQPQRVPPPRHLRVVLELSGARDLRFVDQRMFGGLLVSRDGADLPVEIAHIARDPLDPEFDEADWWSALHRRRTGVKRALLDQSLVSGVGNIYADESLWAARLHYARPTETLRRSEAAALLAQIRAVMSRALREGGTSFDALYVNV
ncbi:MAG: bifunctional DNA-formamidopyrimidine glycosylase/DNA-(apurinic or apyrimidinic site) lyase, partial [Nocardioidaceae bacterium]